jgi:DNA replication protein DnaC
VEHLIGPSGIPPRFADKTFDSYTPTNAASRVALTAARKYADAFESQSRQGRSLVFAGGPGTGKTHLATAIGQHIIRELQAVVLFGTVSQALRRIKDTYRKDSEQTESDVIRALTDCDLLILDEIGAQIGSEHEKQLMFEILNERYQGMKSTILISNLNAEELEGFLGHRVMDRYRECGVVLAFGWESHRGKQAPDAKAKAAGGEP